MWAFAWMFWVIPLLFFCTAARHWRRERWAYTPRGLSPRGDEELEAQREYVDSLERRIAELEERLDFTERLLAGRNQAASSPV